MLKSIVITVNENNIEDTIIRLLGNHKDTYHKILTFLNNEEKIAFQQLLAKLYRKGALDQLWGIPELT